jgi:uncharacterized membrane protein (UPF0127 family)
MSRRAIVVALVALAAIVLAIVVVKVVDDDGDEQPTAPTGSVTSALAHATPATAPFEGLTEVKAAIGGRCLRLAVADSLAERVAGLRGNSADLGPYDGMLFAFPAPTEVGFTMSDVKDGLDIGFFEQDGVRATTYAMKPCPDKAENQCPVYRATGPYTYAVETKPGQLPAGALAACAPS